MDPRANMITLSSQQFQLIGNNSQASSSSHSPANVDDETTKHFIAVPYRVGVVVVIVPSASYQYRTIVAVFNVPSVDRPRALADPDTHDHHARNEREMIFGHKTPFHKSSHSVYTHLCAFMKLQTIKITITTVNRHHPWMAERELIAISGPRDGQTRHANAPGRCVWKSLEAVPGGRAVVSRKLARKYEKWRK